MERPVVDNFLVTTFLHLLPSIVTRTFTGSSTNGNRVPVYNYYGLASTMNTISLYDTDRAALTFP